VIRTRPSTKHSVRELLPADVLDVRRPRPPTTAVGTGLLLDWANSYMASPGYVEQGPDLPGSRRTLRRDETTSSCGRGITDRTLSSGQGRRRARPAGGPSPRQRPGEEEDHPKKA
jgi:hypothetical protein